MREQTRHRYFNSRVFVRVRRSSFARKTATLLSGFDAGPLDAKLGSSSLGPIAQLDRASGYEPGGRRFESCWARFPRDARKAVPSRPREARRFAFGSAPAVPSPAKRGTLAQPSSGSAALRLRLGASGSESCEARNACPAVLGKRRDSRLRRSSRAVPSPGEARKRLLLASRSQRAEKRHEVRLFVRSQPQREPAVVEVHHVSQRRRRTVVEVRGAAPP